MIKNDYVIRAQKTAMLLARYLDEEKYSESLYPHTKSTCFIYAVRRLNLEKHRHIQFVVSGATRNVIISSDYVIKMDKVEKSRWGTSKDEREAYEKLVKIGKDYLVAPTTPFKYKHYTFYIMPRCSEIEQHEVEDFPNDDFKFIRDNFTDTHSGNIGKFHKRLVLIDYAANYL